MKKQKGPKSEAEFIARCNKARALMAEEMRLGAVCDQLDKAIERAAKGDRDRLPDWLIEDLTAIMSPRQIRAVKDGYTDVMQSCRNGAADQIEELNEGLEPIEYLLEYKPSTPAGILVQIGLCIEWLGNEGSPRDDFNVTATREARRLLNEALAVIVPSIRAAA